MTKITIDKLDLIDAKDCLQRALDELAFAFGRNGWSTVAEDKDLQDDIKVILDRLTEKGG